MIDESKDASLCCHSRLGLKKQLVNKNEKYKFHLSHANNVSLHALFVCFYHFIFAQLIKDLYSLGSVKCGNFIASTLN